MDAQTQQAWDMLARGEFAGAEAAARNLITQDPSNGKALHLLGVLAARVGQYKIAGGLFERALQFTPEDPVLMTNIGYLLFNVGDMKRSLEFYNRAIELGGDNAVVRANMAAALTFQHRLEESAQNSRRAIELDPNSAAAHNKLGEVLKEQGRVDESIASFRRALEIDRTYEDARHGLMLGLNYQPAGRADEIAREHCDWGRRVVAQLGNPVVHLEVDRNPDRKLRIGYVSGDFWAHAVSFFLEPILAHRDRENFELFAYSNSLFEDETTKRLRSYFDRWRDIQHTPIDHAAHAVAEDRIDILVDLSVHSARNRLALFARRAAPVQVTYLGYPGPTGLPTMDFRLTDRFLDPDESNDEASESEIPIRMPRTYFCYRPPVQSPEVRGRAGGPIVFGWAGNFSKIHAGVLEMWAKAVLASPADSILKIKSKTLGDEPARASLLVALEQFGLSRDRVRLEFISALPEYLQYLGGFDIALDTFPFSGATTMCHTLWQGVPVVSRAGETGVSRMGKSILNAIGLPELCAESSDQFVEIASKLASDPDRLRELRATMRDRMKQSPLMDEAGFARDLESAYRSMWRQFCAS